MRPSRTKTTAKTTTSAIDAFKAAAAEAKPQEPRAQLLYSIAFTNKFLPERMWNKLCSDGTVRLIGTVARSNNVTHQGKPVSDDQLAGLTVEVRVTPDQFEAITGGAEDMVGAGVSVLFEVGEPSFSELTANGEEVNSIVFYTKSFLGMEVNQTAIGSLGFKTKTEMDDWLSAARSQSNNRQKRRQEERTSRLQAARAAADAANNNNTEWATPAASTNPMD
jgi:hypothetical protein